MTMPAADGRGDCPPPFLERDCDGSSQVANMRQIGSRQACHRRWESLLRRNMKR